MNLQFEEFIRSFKELARVISEAWDYVVKRVRAAVLAFLPWLRRALKLASFYNATHYWRGIGVRKPVIRRRWEMLR